MFSYIFPAVGQIRDFHPLECVHAGHTMIRLLQSRSGGFVQAAMPPVEDSDIINLMTDKNPIQILADAVANAGPREDSTRIGTSGVVRRQAVDVSPFRRVSFALSLLTTGVGTERRGDG